MKKTFRVNHLDRFDVDFIGIVNLFNIPDSVEEVKLVGIMSTSPDNHFYKLQCSTNIYYLYEVDYISNLEEQIKYIEDALGFKIELFTVKIPHPSYEKPLSQYITDYSGSQPFYHKFLFKKRSL